MFLRKRRDQHTYPIGQKKRAHAHTLTSTILINSNLWEIQLLNLYYNQAESSGSTLFANRRIVQPLKPLVINPTPKKEKKENGFLFFLEESVIG